MNDAKRVIDASNAQWIQGRVQNNTPVTKQIPIRQVPVQHVNTVPQQVPKKQIPVQTTVAEAPKKGNNTDPRGFDISDCKNINDAYNKYKNLIKIRPE